MITILICWYCLGWACLSYVASSEKVLYTKDVIVCFTMTPLLMFVLPVALYDRYGDHIIWRAKA